MVCDNGLNDTGFPGLRVEVKKPGRLVLQSDEVQSANGEVRGIRRYKDCCNALVWDFAAPGVYEVDAFEPYTMRYVELDVVSGGAARPQRPRRGGGSPDEDRDGAPDGRRSRLLRRHAARPRRRDRLRLDGEGRTPGGGVRGPARLAAQPLPCEGA